MPFTAAAEARQPDEVFRSWKEIASYLGRSVRTVQRWEKEHGLPVHRVSLAQRGAIYASRIELDDWWASRSASLQSESEHAATTAESVEADTVAPAVAAAGHNRFWLVFVAASVALLCGVAILMAVLSGQADQRLLTGVPITTRPGLNAHPALSPDGKALAFVWSPQSDGNADVYVQALNADAPQQVTRTNRALFAAWAPDGRHLAYLQRSGLESAELWTLDLSSRQAHRIAEVHQSLEGFPRGSLLTWTPDGRSIILTHRERPGSGAALFSVSVASGAKRRLTDPPTSGFEDISPRISPDQALLAFLREELPNKLELCYEPWKAAATRASTCLALRQQRMYGFAFGPDPATVFASLADTGFAGQIWEVPLRSPRHAVRFPVADNAIFEPTYAAGKLAYVAGDIRVALREYRLDGDKANSPETIAPSDAIEIWPQLSPDGSRLAFVSNRSGNYDVWIVDANRRTDPRRVSRLNGSTAGNIIWSPDGREIAFVEMVAGKVGIYASTLNGGTPRLLPLTDPAPYTVRGWSRNRRYLYIEAGRHSGATKLVELDLTNDREKVVATAPRDALLSITVDGSAFLEVEGDELKRVDRQSGAQTLLGRGSWLDFDVDPKGLLLRDAMAPGQTSCITQFSFQTRRGVDIGPCTCNGPGAAVSPDGKRLICSEAAVHTELKYVTVR